MDPNASLTEQRLLRLRIWDNLEKESPNQTQLAEDADRLADLMLALDDWLVRGGALPRAWGLRYRDTSDTKGVTALTAFEADHEDA